MSKLTSSAARDIIAKNYDPKTTVVEVVHLMPVDIGHIVLFNLKNKPATSGPRAKRNMAAVPFLIDQQRIAHIVNNQIGGHLLLRAAPQPLNGTSSSGKGTKPQSRRK